MSFEVAADAYDRFMGGYSEPLAEQLVGEVGVHAGQRALDVGCGPGALLTALVPRLGADGVCAVEPSAPFAAAAVARFPGVRIVQAGAEQLPYDEASFDVVIASLAVHFMRDPVGGLREMRRVVVDGGRVAATVWDEAGNRGPLSPFWRAAEAVVADVPGEKHRAGARAGHLAELFAAAGLRDVEAGELSVTRSFASFDDWWQLMELGVGPAGDFVQSLVPAARRAVREACHDRLPEGRLDITGTAWSVVARP